MVLATKGKVASSWLLLLGSALLSSCRKDATPKGPSCEATAESDKSLEGLNWDCPENWTQDQKEQVADQLSLMGYIGED
jgi:hypothetical protein